MSRKENAPQRRKGISVLNWMGTLILCAIPGVNVVALVLMAILAKSKSKRHFAAAALILMGIAAVLTIIAFVAFGEFLTEFAQALAKVN